MKAYSDYNGVLPEGVQVVREGLVTRIFFDFVLEEKKIEDETIQQVVCENVDVIGQEYGDIVTAIIRDRYTPDMVEAILANGKDSDEHKAELKAFQDWRAKAKEIAKIVIAQ